MNNSTGDVHQTARTGNCLAAVYLANSTTSTSKLPLRNLAFSQSVPVEVRYFKQNNNENECRVNV